MSRAGALVRFSDCGKISGYAWHSMEWAVTRGILAGSDGKLNPQGAATRAQVAQAFKNAHDLLAGEPDQPTPVPTATPTPDAPKINMPDVVRAKLKPNQDPEKLLDYVLHGKNDGPTFTYDGTTAAWDPYLPNSTNYARYYSGSWESDENEMRGSPIVAKGFVQMLTRTASDRFYITAEDSDGCFCLYYHPAEMPDSQRMKAVKAALGLPSSKKFSRPLCYEGAGWAGPMDWEVYGANGIATKIEYYLLDMHPYTTEYYLTEPSPGIFYLLYGAGNT